MKLPAYQFVAQMSAALAVVVSLGFVAFELKQARDIALAEIYQERSNMSIQIIMSQYSSEQLESAWTELQSEEPQLSFYQIEAAGLNLEAYFVYFENIHFQRTLGMVTDEEWLSTQEFIKGQFARRCTADWWNDLNKSTYRDSFVLVVYKLLSQMEIPRCPLSPPK